MWRTMTGCEGVLRVRRGWLWGFVLCATSGCPDAPTPAAPARDVVDADAPARDAVDEAPPPRDVPVEAMRAPGCDPTVPEVPSCGDAQAPVPNGNGGFDCIAVGPLPPSGSEWPTDVDASVFVRADATGGDGSRGAPYGSIAEALRVTAGGGVVAVARGTYDLVGPVALRNGQQLVGAGAGDASDGGVTVRVSVTDGGAPLTVTESGASVAVRGVQLTPPGTANVPVALAAGGAGVTLTVEDVRFTRTGLLVGDQARLSATRVAIAEALSGLVVIAADASFVNGHIRGSSNQLPAILSSRGCVDLRDSLIERSGGVVFDGRGTPARACRSMQMGRCSYGGRSAASLDRVAVVGSVAAGVSVVGPQNLSARRIYVAGTQAVGTGTEARFGAGVEVDLGGALALDVEGCASDDCAGTQSVLRGNEGTGILVHEACADVRGVAVARNGAAGAYVQNGSNGQILYSCFRENRGFGIGLLRPGSVEIGCNGIFDTRDLVTYVPDRSVFPIGYDAFADGISYAATPAPDAGLPSVLIHDNRLDRNGRFGLILGFGPSSAGVTNNRGDDNRYDGALALTLEGPAPRGIVRIVGNAVRGRAAYDGGVGPLVPDGEIIARFHR